MSRGPVCVYPFEAKNKSWFGIMQSFKMLDSNWTMLSETAQYAQVMLNNMSDFEEETSFLLQRVLHDICTIDVRMYMIDVFICYRFGTWTKHTVDVPGNQNAFQLRSNTHPRL